MARFRRVNAERVTRDPQFGWKGRRSEVVVVPLVEGRTSSSNHGSQLALSLFKWLERF